MDTGLILLLALCIGLSIQTFYFGFLKPPETLSWLQQSGVIISSFLLIPILCYVLYTQAGTISRLEKFGLIAHPAIESSFVHGNGYGDNPTWVFELEPTEATPLEFYRKSANTGEWNLLEDNGLMLSYTRGIQRMTITSRKTPGTNNLIIMIESQ